MERKTNFKQTEIGKIPEDWSLLTIDDVAEVVGGGTPSTKDLSNFGGDIPWITPKDLSSFSFRYISRGERNITQRGLEESSVKLLPPNAVLLTTRAPVGYVAIAKNKVTTNQGFRSLIPRHNVISEYLYYLLKINTERLKSNASGTTFGELSGSTLKSLKFPFPQIEEQHAIAKILFDLDEKIELNHQMNKTLESIAQAIFKRWFVDFEFPGHEKVKFVNGLPEGWRHGTLGEIISIESGKRPGEKSETKTQGFTVPLIGASSVMGFVKDALYDEPILIIGRVGTHGVVQRVSWPSFPSDNTLVIRSKHFEFVYQLLKTIDYESLNVGTTQPLITQTAINKYDVVIPNNEALEQFETYISGLFKKVVANNKETESLVDIRDSLLPRLMSGKIRVNICEKEN